MTKKWVLVLLEAKWVVIPLVLFNLFVLGVLFMTSVKWPPLLSSGLLAYSFGLRHAVDADHLAAIDNVTRRMMADGKRPLTIGLFFSLGHSTIVFFLSFLVAVTAGAIENYDSGSLAIAADVVGTTISAGFLALIGFINLFCLIRVVKDYKLLQKKKRLALENPSVYQTFPKKEEEELSFEETTTTSPSPSSSTVTTTTTITEVIDEEEGKLPPSDSSSASSSSSSTIIVGENMEIVEEISIDGKEQQQQQNQQQLQQRLKEAESTAAPGGLMTKCCPKLLNLIDAPWKMYIVGFLFGLGFDTASEVALLGITAVAPGEGVPPFMVMILPTLFAAGMALIDSLDGIFMMWAYGWAFIEPEQKLLYNFVITLTSLLIAFFIGGVEVLGVFQETLGLTGPFWTVVSELNSEYSGLVVIAIFAFCFLCSVLAFYYRRCSQRRLAAASTASAVAALSREEKGRSDVVAVSSSSSSSPSSEKISSEKISS